MDNANTSGMYQPQPDEKLNSVMIYTSHDIYWGNVAIKQQFRASTWLQTSAAPDFLTFLNGKVIHTLLGGNPNPIAVPEAHIPFSEVVLFHLTPPEFDQMEVDPNAAKMQSIDISVTSGSFVVDGRVEISAKTTLTGYLTITRETFYGIHDASIRCLTMPSFGTVKVKFVIARIKNSILSIR